MHERFYMEVIQLYHVSCKCKKKKKLKKERKKRKKNKEGGPY